MSIAAIEDQRSFRVGYFQITNDQIRARGSCVKLQGKRGVMVVAGISRRSRYVLPNAVVVFRDQSYWSVVSTQPGHGSVYRQGGIGRVFQHRVVFKRGVG